MRFCTSLILCLLIFLNSHAQVTISEINYNSDDTRDAGDWVEFLNYGPTPIDISEWVFTDSQVNHFFLFPPGTTLAPGERIVLAQELSLFTSQHPTVSNVLGSFTFGLGGGGELIRLFDNFNNLYLAVTYSDSLPWPKTPDGYGRTLELIDPYGNLNDGNNWFAGCMGGSPGEAFTPCDEQLIFSEINYNSSSQYDTKDWVEIRNIGTFSIDLTGWKFSDKNDTNMYLLPNGTIINPGENIILAENKNAFLTKYPWMTSKVYGPFSFGLRSYREVIRLFDSTGKIYTSMFYDTSAPWPVMGNGDGYTLEILDPTDLMENSQNWFAGCLYGSPATDYNPNCTTSDQISSENIENFYLFPNPVNKNEKINFGKQISGILTVKNVLGSEIISSEINNSYFKIPDYISSGIYILNIIDSGKSFTSKLIIK